MITRMRASADELNRAYLKYNTPDTLAKFKLKFLLNHHKI